MGPKASREQYQDQQHSHHHRHQHSYTKSETYYPSSVLSYATMDRRIPLTTNDYSRVAAQEIQNLQKHNRTRYPSTSEISSPQEKSMETPSSYNYVETKRPRIDQNTPKPKLGIRQSRSFNNLSDANTVVTAQQLMYDQAKRRQRNKSPSIISVNSNQSSNLERSTSSTNLSQSSYSQNKRKKIPDDFKFVSINPKDIQVNQISVENKKIVFSLFLWKSRKQSLF